MADDAMLVGKQPGHGWSTMADYLAADRSVRSWKLPRDAEVIDVGGGAGNFTRIMLEHVDRATVLDCEERELGPRIRSVACDLNDRWPLESASADAIVTLEVIEHVENPRHFFREIARVLKPGGRMFLTTPNQLSLASRLCLMVKDQFQWFQDSCYPAHITALLPIDLHRIAREVGLAEGTVSYTDLGRIPFTHREWQNFTRAFRGKLFSDSVCFTCRKPGAEVSAGT
jgi:2-polyprenyl-3-methyl-5-hydroxy-6-metoxy-1,4-benzoquinol methylase